MKKCDWGWQGEAKKLRVRAEYLLMNLASLPIPADITFVFDKNGLATLSAHKIFLAIGSEVFMAMFYGPAADTTQTNVPIPNYSKAVFEALVHYLYSDRIPDSFTKLKDDGLWMELLESAVQYGVPELATKCRVAIDDRLRTDNAGDEEFVRLLLSQARKLDETEIERIALRALDDRPIEILSELPNISRDFLAEIVQRSELNVRGDQEIELYNAVRRWAVANTSREKYLPEPCSEACEHCTIKMDPVRQLGPVFQHIRFPLMSASQLANGPIADGIFTSAEVSRLFALKLSGNAAPLLDASPFSSLQRRTKLPIHAGELYIQYKPYRQDEWRYMLCLNVVLDWETCPATSRRFIQLCEKGYEFSLVAKSERIAGHALQVSFDVEPEQTIKDLFLPLPTSENSLMHDSGGTVSLSLAKNDMGEGFHYTLFISPDKEQKDTGTVFGRLADWDASLYLMEGSMYVKKKVAQYWRVIPDVGFLKPY